MLGLMCVLGFIGILWGGESWQQKVNREEYQQRKDVIALADRDKPRARRRQEAPRRGRYAACPGAHWRERQKKGKGCIAT